MICSVPAFLMRDIPSKPNLMTTYNDFFPILYSVGESVRILSNEAVVDLGHGLFMP